MIVLDREWVVKEIIPHRIVVIPRSAYKSPKQPSLWQRIKWALTQLVDT